MITQLVVFVFFFNDTATTEIYTLSLHDALPIYPQNGWDTDQFPNDVAGLTLAMLYILKGGGMTNGGFNFDAKIRRQSVDADRKSTRLNSSHANISYAVFCLKKKKI